MYLYTVIVDGITKLETRNAGWAETRAIIERNVHPDAIVRVIVSTDCA